MKQITNDEKVQKKKLRVPLEHLRIFFQLLNLRRRRHPKCRLRAANGEHTIYIRTITTTGRFSAPYHFSLAEHRVSKHLTIYRCKSSPLTVL